MAASGAEPLGSMGTDTPTAVLSQRSRLLYDYFVELFAQVTNPPLDAIREEVVTSMARVMGPEQNLLEPTAASCRQIVLRRPVLDNDELNKIVHINDDREHPGLKTAVLRALYDVGRGGEGLADALDDLRQRACNAIAKGARTLVISDRDSDHTRAPIPSLLAISAVHHHLVRTGAHHGRARRRNR
jgi:glutamate synthase (NADPH/NADH) large chain/glutamate synthase (ferredoxin)